MPTPTLDDLLTIPTQDEVLDQEVLPELVKRGVRVTDWAVGGVYRALGYVIAFCRADVRKALAALAAAHFEDYCFGFSTPPGGIDVTGWAPFVAKQRYGLDRIEATYTKRKITLTNASAVPYGPLQAGAIILAFPSGNRYVLDETTTIPAAGSVQAVFRSEYKTDSAAGLEYSTDPAAATINFVTASYPGVTATNPAPTFSDVASVGAGTGTITPSGAPGAAHRVAVRIDVAGVVGGGSWSTSVDGLAWVSQGAINNIVNLGGLGINITPANNGGSPSFPTDALFYFTTPGSDITQVGRDIETPQELGTRCRGLWPSLAFAQDPSGLWIPASPTTAAYEALARSASSQVKVCFVTTGTVNNEVKIYIAGQGALLSAAAIASVQAFFDHFDMITDLPVVMSPDTQAVTLGGATITTKSAQLATAQAALTTSLQKYLGGVDPVAPLGVNGRIDHAYIVRLIRSTTGVTKVTDTALTINGAAADLQLPTAPGTYQIATWGQTVASAFTWLTE